MAQQIPGLGRVAGPDQTTKRLLPELLEHLKDEESRVREAAAVSLCEMPDLVPATIRDTRVFPAIREVFHTAAATCPPSTSSSSSTRRALGHGPGKDAYYVPVVHKPSANSQAKNDDKHRTRKLAEALGPMSLRVADTIDPTTAAAVLDFVHTAARAEDETARSHVAKNLFAVFVAVSACVPDGPLACIATLGCLADDLSDEVRYCVAAQIGVWVEAVLERNGSATDTDHATHPTGWSLGDEDAVHRLVDILAALLVDDAFSVRLRALQTVPGYITALLASEDEKGQLGAIDPLHTPSWSLMVKTSGGGAPALGRVGTTTTNPINPSLPSASPGNRPRVMPRTRQDSHVITDLVTQVAKKETSMCRTVLHRIWEATYEVHIANEKQEKSWRPQVVLTRAWSALAGLLSRDDVVNRLLPSLKSYLREGGAHAVYKSASRCFWKVMRQPSLRLYDRVQMYMFVVRELARSKSFMARLIFVHLVEGALRECSTRFVREYLFHFLTELTDDPVVNIRVKLSTILVQVKNVIRLPEDVAWLEILNGTIARLMSDSSNEVAREARLVSDAIRAQPFRMSRPSPSSATPGVGRDVGSGTTVTRGTSLKGMIGVGRDGAGAGAGAGGSRHGAGGATAFESKDTQLEQHEEELTIFNAEMELVRDMALKRGMSSRSHVGAKKVAKGGGSTGGSAGAGAKNVGRTASDLGPSSVPKKNSTATAGAPKGVAAARQGAPSATARKSSSFSSSQPSSRSGSAARR